jgi:type IV secretion system protein TrbI
VSVTDETPRSSAEAPEQPAQTTEPVTPRKPVRPVLWGLWALVIIIVTLAVIQFSGGGGATTTSVRRQESGPAPKTADEQQIAEFEKQQQAEAERLRREQEQAQEALADAKRSYQDSQNSQRHGSVAPPMPDAGPQPGGVNGAVQPVQAQVQERQRRRRAALNASMIAIDFSGGTAEQKPQNTESATLLSGQESHPSPEPENEGRTEQPTQETGDAALTGAQNSVPAIDSSTRPVPEQTSVKSRRGINYDLDSATGPQYVLLEGTVLDSVLTNRLEGEYTGPVNVMLTTDMWNHDRSRLLIPKGTRLLGEARQVSSQNQRRLAVAFHRMIMPDGFSYNLDQFMGLDQQGATGLSDKVNHHYLKMFGAAIAVGGIGGLAQIGAGYNGFAYDPGVAIRTGISQQMGQEATQILDRFLNVLPQLTIREGTRVRVWLTQDIAMPAYANHTMDPALETRAKAGDFYRSRPGAN